MPNEIEGWFPNLAGSGYEIIGEATDQYNCIAWALGITSPWWGYQNPGDYWPPSLPRNSRIETLVQLFAAQGFSLCGDALPEPGYEKVALFAFVGHFTHAARQIDSGLWTSKLGEREAIVHPALENLSESAYGFVHCIMSRPTAAT